MQAITRRWRRRAEHTRSRRPMVRAIEAADTRTLAAELRAIASTQYNR